MHSTRQYHFHAILHAMKTTIDSAGRIVVPKALRDALQLKPGQPLEVRANDGRLEIEVASVTMKLVKRGKGLVAVPDEPLPRLTASEVRATLERTRR
jgi:AbrB family looped-hinge helix DNA binding protein